MTPAEGSHAAGPPAVLHVRSDVDAGYEELMRWSDLHHRVALSRPGWSACSRFELAGPDPGRDGGWRILTVYDLADEAAAARRNEPDHATPPLPAAVGSVRRRRAVYREAAGTARCAPVRGTGHGAGALVQVLADVADPDEDACAAWFAGVSPALGEVGGIHRARALLATEVDGPPAGLRGDEWMELYEFDDEEQAASSLDLLSRLPDRPVAPVQVALYRRNFHMESGKAGTRGGARR